jgi:plasmid segregation protein ParM
VKAAFPRYRIDEIKGPMARNWRGLQRSGPNTARGVMAAERDRAASEPGAVA